MSLKTWILGGAVCAECEHYRWVEKYRSFISIPHQCIAYGETDSITGKFENGYCRVHNIMGNCYRFQQKQEDTEP